MAKGSIKDMLAGFKDEFKEDWGDLIGSIKNPRSGHYEWVDIPGTNAKTRRWMYDDPEEATPSPTRVSTRAAPVPAPTEPPVATPEDMILPEVETTELHPLLGPDGLASRAPMRDEDLLAIIQSGLAIPTTVGSRGRKARRDRQRG